MERLEEFWIDIDRLEESWKDSLDLEGVIRHWMNWMNFGKFEMLDKV